MGENQSQSSQPDYTSARSPIHVCRHAGGAGGAAGRPTPCCSALPNPGGARLPIPTARSTTMSAPRAR